MPAHRLVKKMQPTGESFGNSAMIYLVFKESIRRPLLGLSALQHLKMLFINQELKQKAKFTHLPKASAKSVYHFLSQNQLK